MSLADQLLIGWWIAAVIFLPLAWFVMERWARRQDSKATLLAYTRGVSLQELRYRYPTGGNFVGALLWIFVVTATLVLLVSFFVMLSLHNETRFYVLQSQVLFTIAGTIMVCSLCSQHAFPPLLFTDTSLDR